MMARLALRNLSAHRLRLLFTAVAVVLGVSFAAGTMIFRDTASRAFEDAFGDRSQAREVSVAPKQPFTGEGAQPRLIDAATVESLKGKVPGADQFRSVVEGYAVVIDRNGEVVGGDGVAHRGRAYVEGGPESKMRILTGRAPTAENDLVVEEQTAAEGGITVGDSVPVVTRSGQRTMTVVGVFTLGEERIGDVVTYVGFSPAVAEQLLTRPGHYSAVWVRPKAGVSQEQLATQLTAALPADYEVSTAQQLVADARERIKSFFGLLSAFLLAFAGVSVLVGSFIIFNTFTMLVAQRTREMALLRAVGASRRQVTRAVIVEALVVGVVGSTGGIGVGVGIALALQALFSRFGTELPSGSPVVTPATVLWAYAIGTLVTVAAAYLPARRAARIPPIAALRDEVALPTRSHRIRLVFGVLVASIGGLIVALSFGSKRDEAPILLALGGILLLFALVLLGPVLSRPVVRLVGWPIARLGGTAGQLSRRNAYRDPRRTAATASALMIGLAMVSVATVVSSSLSASADRRLDREFGADFSLDSRGLTGFGPQAADQVAAVPGVRAVTPVRLGTMRIDEQEAPVTVADPAALVTPVNLRIETGRATLGADEILVERSAADELGLEVGSTTPAQYPDGARVTLRVVGIFADNQVLDRPYLVGTAGYLAHSDTDQLQRAYVDVDDAQQAAATERIRSVLRAYPAVQLRDRQDAKDDARAEIEQVLNAILALLVLSILVAAIGIVNTLGLSVVERTREIGLLRAVGMGRGQVRAMIRYESVVIALFGTALGLALGVGLGVAAQRALSSNGIEVLDLSVGRLALYLLAAIGIGVLAALWPAWRAARMNVLDAISQR
ncbi:FtsX-like permease family protein [Micromonospora sp. WMMD975]|uniref:ABC transporter permease n=1 Tax=Micromonospora sp. WMMD975 TaxID=3016087 RepID=UPI00249B9638|nr:FtsX-like permease family protein [Micromonospora sp. WMMD975]WFE36470.1 FtsX-like permease family protein [Micromonospora sp. WMMD975]